MFPFLAVFTFLAVKYDTAEDQIELHNKMKNFYDLIIIDERLPLLQGIEGIINSKKACPFP